MVPINQELCLLELPFLLYGFSRHDDDDDNDDDNDDDDDDENLEVEEYDDVEMNTDLAV